MRAMLPIEYRFVMQELQPLKGKFLENIYSIGTSLRFRIGGTDLICEPGVRLHATRIIEKDEALSSFVSTLRRELRNARLLDLYLYNNDRIVVFDFGRKKLVCEMFAKGNIILVEENVTHDALHSESWSDRTIARNKPYSFPQSRVKETAAEALAAAPDRYCVVALLQLPLGKEYVRELLARCGIDEKKSAASLSSQEINAFQSAYEDIIKNGRAYGAYEGEHLVTVSLVKPDTAAVREFHTLSEALDEYYFQNREVKNEKLEKLKKRLAEQLKRLDSLKDEEQELKKKGDFLYQSYEQVDALLTHARSLPLDELEGKLRVKVNKKEKEIEVEL